MQERKQKKPIQNTNIELGDQPESFLDSCTQSGKLYLSYNAIKENHQQLMFADKFHVYFYSDPKDRHYEFLIEIDKNAMEAAGVSDLLPPSMRESLGYSYLYSPDGINFYELKYGIFNSTRGEGREIYFYDDRKKYIVTFNEREAFIGKKSEDDSDIENENDDSNIKKFLSTNLKQKMLAINYLLASTHTTNKKSLQDKKEEKDQSSALAPMQQTYSHNTDSHVEQERKNILHEYFYYGSTFPTRNLLSVKSHKSGDDLVLASTKSKTLNIIRYTGVYQPSSLYQLGESDDFIYITTNPDNKIRFKFQLIKNNICSEKTFEVKKFFHLRGAICDYILDEQSGFKRLHIQENCPCCKNRKEGDILHLETVNNEKIPAKNIPITPALLEKFEIKVEALPEWPAPIDSLPKPKTLKDGNQGEVKALDSQKKSQSRFRKRFTLEEKEQPFSQMIANFPDNQELSQLYHCYELLRRLALIESKVTLYDKKLDVLAIKDYDRGIVYPIEKMLQDTHDLLQKISIHLNNKLNINTILSPKFLASLFTCIGKAFLEFEKQFNCESFDEIGIEVATLKKKQLVLIFLQAIENVITQNSFPVDDILSFLSRQNKRSFNFVLVAAREQRSKEIDIKIIQILTQLLNKGLAPAKIAKLLLQRTPGGVALSDFIIDMDVDAINSFLELVSKLPPQERYSVLASQDTLINKDKGLLGLTFGHRIADYRNSNAIKSYLKLLIQWLGDKPSRETCLTILSLLKIQDKEKNANVGMRIALHLPDFIPEYLAVLEKLSAGVSKEDLCELWFVDVSRHELIQACLNVILNNVKPSRIFELFNYQNNSKTSLPTIFELLSYQNSDGNTLLHTFILRGNQEITSMVKEFLQKLIQANPELYWQKILELPNKNGIKLSDFISIQNNTEEKQSQNSVAALITNFSPLYSSSKVSNVPTENIHPTHKF